MSDDNKIRVRIQRGTSQIGGVCTEVFTDQTRIFFDFGTPLEGEGNQDKLEIEGLTFGVANTDAVFLTHYHGDHVGEVPNIISSIPVYMHKTARKILQAQQEHKVGIGEIVWAKDVLDLSVDEPVFIKDLKITPLISDHSAIGSLMFLIEGYGKRILITGDYRLHGYYEEKVRKSLSSLKHIDLMITEGTNIFRGPAKYQNEQEVQDEFKNILTNKRYVFLLASSSNIDRISAFTRCVPDGEYPLVDDYQMKVLKIANEDCDKEFKSKKQTQFIVNKTLTRGTQNGFGMVVRANDRFKKYVKDFFEQYPNETCLIYSMWKGYETIPDVAELLEIAKPRTEFVHVSGHVTKEDLEEVLEIVKPEKLIIHHTQAHEEENKVKIPKSTSLMKVVDGIKIVI